jgi:hypothetical protein
MMDLDNLLQEHPAYQHHASQADYYYRSYIGGEQYKAGEYLTKYIGEENSPGDQYYKRIQSTPLDNQVATTIDIYRSFLFRNLPHRTLGLLHEHPLVHEWLNDTDQEGQSLNSFLKTMNDLAMVQGNQWILVDKPSYAVDTQAQEIELGIRAYAVNYSPANVLDWYYERNIAGKRELKYIKVIESNNDEFMNITVWYPDHVHKYKVEKDTLNKPSKIVDMQEYPNPLGYVPFICHSPLKSPTMGMGYSIIADVANAQKSIYNLYSELEQTIRISSHPTLVKTPSTDATAGAGGIVTIQEDIDPQLKPYLLTPGNSTISGILSSIGQLNDSIKRMTHTAAVQAVTGQPMSGVALKVEQNLLNARLADISDTIRETEIKMWRIWADWQALQLPEEFDIEYSESFDLQDEHARLEFLTKARASGVQNPLFQKEIDRQLIHMVVEDDEEANLMITEANEGFKPHTMTNPQTGDVLVANTEEEHLALGDQGYVHVDEL